MGQRLNWSECVDELEDLYGDTTVDQDMLEACVEFDELDLANQVFRTSGVQVVDLGAL